jgi:hypothetical protein
MEKNQAQELIDNLNRIARALEDISMKMSNDGPLGIETTIVDALEDISDNIRTGNP